MFYFQHKSEIDNILRFHRPITMPGQESRKLKTSRKNTPFWFTFVLAIGVMFLCILSLFANDKEQFESGLDYLILEEGKLQRPDTEKIEVVEYFSYGCVHCFRFERHIKKWLETIREDVVFAREAVVMRESAIPYARAFYAAEELEVTKKVHDLMFRTIHTERTSMRSDDRLTTFFEEQAEIAPDEFLEVLYSEKVRDRILATHEDFDVVGRASVASTPQIVVDNRYVVTTRTAGSQARIFQIVDFLVDNIRTETESSRAEQAEPAL